MDTEGCWSHTSTAPLPIHYFQNPSQTCWISLTRSKISSINLERPWMGREIAASGKILRKELGSSSTLLLRTATLYPCVSQILFSVSILVIWQWIRQTTRYVTLILSFIVGLATVRVFIWSPDFIKVSLCNLGDGIIWLVHILVQSEGMWIMMIKDGV